MRAEEALRLVAPYDRLLVLRRLDLGRLPVSAAGSAWALRTAGRVAALAALAVHGGEPDAGNALAVWFHSAAEARRLLLVELATGRTPAAWFWRLAVPGWRGLALDAWLPLLIAEAEASPERAVELARAMAALAAVRGPNGLIAVLAVARHALPPEALYPGLPSAQSPASQAAHAAVTARAERLLRSHAAPEQAALLAALARLPPGEPAIHWLARMVLLAVAPELAAQETNLRATAAALVRIASRSPATPRPPPSPQQAGAVSPATPETAAAPQLAVLRIPAVPETPVVADVDAPSPLSLQPDARARPAEQFSAGAGLWLLVRPLEAMGIDDWLGRRPALAAEGFSRALLRHVAERMRLAADDPLFEILRGEPFAPPHMEGWQAALVAWRVGADRWLRRRVGRRLGDVVRRRGWLTVHEAGLVVRFRGDAADILLRRRALDVDPGWVPWLGLSIQYQYRDEAAP